MNLNNHFDLSRFWLLLKMELYRSKKGILMAFVISFGLLFFLGLLLTPVFEPNMVIYTHSDSYAVNLLISGFILSSLAFNDLSNPLKRYHYLTLPASNLEKFLSMWLLTSIGWIVAYTLFYTIYTLFANVAGQMLFSYMTFESFRPLSEFAITTIRYYFVLQGIFLVGATHFKGYVFPKTLITLILFAIVAALIAYFILTDVIDADTEECVSEATILEGTFVHKIWLVAVWLFWWVLAPLCWVISYFGLKDKEG